MITDFNKHKNFNIVKNYTPVELALHGLYATNYKVLTGRVLEASLPDAAMQRMSDEESAATDIQQFLPLAHAGGSALLELMDALRIYDNLSSARIGVVPGELFKVKGLDPRPSLCVHYGDSGCIDGHSILITLTQMPTPDVNKVRGQDRRVLVKAVKESWDSEYPHPYLVGQLLSVFFGQSLSLGQGYGVAKGEDVTILEYSFMKHEQQFLVRISLDNALYQLRMEPPANQ